MKLFPFAALILLALVAVASIASPEDRTREPLVAAHPFSFWKSGTPMPTPSSATNTYALFFNGTSQYVTLPSAAVDPNSAFTVEAWIKVATGGTNVIFSSGSNAVYWTFINRNDGNGLCFQYNVGGGGAFVNAGAATIAPADGWTHVALTRAGDTFTIYKNGAILKSASSALTGLTTASQRIAFLPDGAFFNGRIDEVRTWNVARTQQQISDNRSLIISAGTTGLTGYWRFESGSGTTATDDTANARHGTLVNAPTWSTDKPF